MKQLFFYALCWLFSMDLGAGNHTEVAVAQTFSTSQTNIVTEQPSVRLKEIDVANPLFIFK
jgi:hypothetical protein